MTPERAKQILNDITSSRFGWQGKTNKFFEPGEIDQVRQVWNVMHGNSCFDDALYRIAHGLTEEHQVSVQKEGDLFRARISGKQIDASNYSNSEEWALYGLWRHITQDLGFEWPDAEYHAKATEQHKAIVAENEALDDVFPLKTTQPLYYA